MEPMRLRRGLMRMLRDATATAYMHTHTAAARPWHALLLLVLTAAGGVTFSPAGVCVCHCIWSAVHTAVSREHPAFMQVAAALVAACLQGPTTVVPSWAHDLQSCIDGESYTRPNITIIWLELAARSLSAVLSGCFFQSLSTQLALPVETCVPVRSRHKPFPCVHRIK
jgi:hypothetical protein